jgi:hypothetical protein
MSFYRAKKYNIKAHLLSDKFALFYDGFHSGDKSTDYFYKILKKTCEEHILVTKVETDVFKWPYNSDGFSFKSAGNYPIKCTKGLPTIIDECHDCDVMMDLTVQPYDFKSDTRVTGVTVKVKSIKVIKSE